MYECEYGLHGGHAVAVVLAILQESICQCQRLSAGLLRFSAYISLGCYNHWHRNHCFKRSSKWCLTVSAPALLVTACNRTAFNSLPNSHGCN